jgi:membrane protease YdiL (CAAX protease family)
MKFIKSILFSIMYAAIYFILQVVIQLVMMFSLGYSIAMENLALTIILSSIIGFLIYWGIIKLRKQFLVSAFSFRKFDYRQIPFFMGLGFCLQYLFQGLILIFNLEDKFPEHAQTIKLIFEGGSPVIVMLSVIIFAPFIEEILFRGLIINELKGKMPLILVILIQSLMFGVIHGNWLQIAYAFIMGILLGLVSIWSRSIWPAIVLHMSMNGSPILISLFWNDDQVEKFITDYRIPVTVISGVLVMVIMYFIYRNRRTDFDVSAIEIPASGTYLEGEIKHENS